MPGAALKSEGPNAAPLCGSPPPISRSRHSLALRRDGTKMQRRGSQPRGPVRGELRGGNRSVSGGWFLPCSAVLAFRGGATALCLRQSLLTSQCRSESRGLPWQTVVFGGPGTLLKALGEGLGQKETAEVGY